MVNGAYVVASETCALEVVGAKFIQDVNPGEIITINDEGLKVESFTENTQHAICSMEYIYFARPDSNIAGVNVHSARKNMGRILANEAEIEADMVVGVPNSSLSAASGYAEESGIPYEMGLVKNQYVARTFIQPTQELREQGVRMKLSAVRGVVEGKRVIMVDDSIVRGTTCANIIRMLKAAGATEVHVRISSPPFLYPCYFGTDVPSNEQLIAHSHTPEQIRKMIGADSLGYMEVSKLKNMVGDLGYCDACFTGKYPMEVPDGDISQAFEQGTR